MCRNNGGKLWILGMKTEKIGTIIETLNGGINGRNYSDRPIVIWARETQNGDRRIINLRPDMHPLCGYGSSVENLPLHYPDVLSSSAQ